MPNARTVLERIGDRVSLPQPAFDRLVRRRHRRERNRRIAAGALGLMVTVALVLALATVSSGPERQPAVTPSIPRSNGAIAYTSPEDDASGGIYLGREGSAPLRIVGETGDGIDELCPAFSPDGTRLAYRVVQWPSTSRLVVAEVSEAGIVPGTTRELVAYPMGEPNLPPCAEWSPDGRYLLYGPDDAGAISIVSTQSGESRVLARGGDDYDWSPDGSKVAVVYGHEVSVIDVVDDGELVATFHRGPTFINEGRTRVAWQPNGTRIAMGSRLYDVEGDTVRELATDATDLGGSPHWSPDGSSIAYQSFGGITIVRVDDGSWLEIPRPDLPGTLRDEEVPFWSFDWSPDGTHIVVALGCSVVTVALDGASPPSLVSSEDVNQWLCTRPPHLDWQAIPR